MPRTRKAFLPPPLKTMIIKGKKYKYKLSDPASKRRRALDSIIQYEANKKRNKTIRQAAIGKKSRLNILRIYRRNKYPKECKTLTRDMLYLDKKYKLNKTSKICKTTRRPKPRPKPRNKPRNKTRKRK